MRFVAATCAILLLGARCGGDPPPAAIAPTPVTPTSHPDWDASIVSYPDPALTLTELGRDLAARDAIDPEQVHSPLAGREWIPSALQSPRTPRPLGSIALVNGAFSTGTIPRSQFVQASASAVAAPWDRVGGQAGRSDRQRRMLHQPLWSDLSLRSSVSHSARNGTSGVWEASHRFEVSRYLGIGRLELSARVTEQEGRRFLEDATLGVETLGGWAARAGSVRLGEPAGVLSAARGRGVELSRSFDLAEGAGVERASVSWGRAAVEHDNVVRGRYPRALARGAVEFALLPDLAMSLDGLTLSQHPSPASALERAWSVGGVVARTGAHLRARAEASVGARRVKEGDASARRASVDLRAERSGLSGGIVLSGSNGTAFRAGPLGALEPLPKSTLAVDLSTRPWRGVSAALWTGSWRHTATWSEGTLPSELNLQNRAYSGRQVGARVGLTWPRSQTGVSFSAELRRRALAQEQQRIWTTGASVSQSLGRSARLSVQGNRFAQEGGTSRSYLSGDLSLRLSDRLNLALEQETVWQEPYGAELVSFVEVSGAPWQRQMLPVSLRLSQSHQQEGTSFRPATRQVSLSSGVRLGARASLSCRINSTESRAHHAASVELGLRHSFDGDGPSATPAEATHRERTRQLLGGVVFEDRNGDHLRQADEPGVAGIEVVVDGDLRAPIPSDLSGRWRSLVAPGRHVLRLLPESIPTSYTLEGTGALEVEVSADRFQEFDFPLERRTGTIAGQVISALADPRAAADPRSLGGVRVLLDDSDITVTDSDGHFAFHALPAGWHRVTLDPESLPPGFRVEGAHSCDIEVAVDGRAEVTCRFVIVRPVQTRRF